MKSNLSDDDLLGAAYHEAAHAVILAVLYGCGSLCSVFRNHTVQDPKSQYLYTGQTMPFGVIPKPAPRVALAGMCAEIISTGCQDASTIEKRFDWRAASETDRILAGPNWKPYLADTVSLCLEHWADIARIAEDLACEYETTGFGALEIDSGLNSRSVMSK